jgi:hypothetical protein
MQVLRRLKLPYKEWRLVKRAASVRHWWLTLVILATWEAEIRRIAV